jgi:hypothetical protein
MKNFIISILLVIYLSGCSVMGSIFKLPEEQTTSQIVVFQDLLKQGWKIHVVNERVILIKYTNNELLIEDVFNIPN